MGELKTQKYQKYQKNLNRKPQFIKMFIKRLIICSIILGIILACVTMYIKNEYEQYIEAVYIDAEENIEARLEQMEWNENNQEFYANTACLSAYTICCGYMDRQIDNHNIIHRLSRLESNIYDRELSPCVEIQLFDKSGELKCSSLTSIFTVVAALDDDGGYNQGGKIYSCNDANKKYDRKSLVNEMNVENFNINLYLKDSLYEFYDKNNTDENELIKQGYESVISNNGSYRMGFYWNQGIIDLEREKGVTKTQSYDTDINLGGEDFTIRIISKYNMWYDIGKIIITIYVTMFMIVILCVLLISYLNYRSRMFNYQNNQYRRNITNAMAHDLKSPLMAITGYVQNILEKINPDKETYYLNEVQSTVDYMNEIIANILNLSKSETLSALKKSNEIKELNIREILVECAKKYKVHMEKSGLTLNILGESRFEGEEIWVKQALDNIISNAVKYSKQNTVIEVNLSEEEMLFKNEINGTIEIDKDRLLEPLVKGDNSRNGQMGTGIGLSIVNNIFARYNYKITVEINNDEFMLKISKKK